MGPYKKLWFLLIAVLAVTFSLLGYYGAEVYRQAPPVPAKVVTSDGAKLQDVYSRLQDAQAIADRLYERWAELEAKQT